MHRIIIKIFNKILCNDSNSLLREYRNEIEYQILSLNLLRIKKTCYVLFLCNTILLFVDLGYFHSKWSLITAYKRLFYFHFIFEMILIIFLIYYMKNNKIENLRFCKFTNLCFVGSVIIWCEFLSLNAQFIHGQISAYIICMFCIASLIILSLWESIVIFLSSYLTFILGLFLIQSNSYQLNGHIINSFFIITLSLVVSRSSFSTFIRHVLNENIIISKNQEIETLNKDLEKKVEERTNELLYAKNNLELEKLRVSFFTNISHEFKTPINVILSAEQLIQYKLKQTLTTDTYTSINKHMFSIRQNCYRLIRLVSNLIDITKVDCGSMGIKLENVNIVKTIEDIVLSIADFIKAKNIELIFDTQVEERIMAIDIDKLERVILNLLSNAIKFSPANGSILVNIYEQEDKLMISVKDTGIGIPLEMQKVIFDRFVQADKSLTRNREGSGIGLSLVKSIVEMHKGNISVTSEPGVGSEFIIELPIYVLEGGAIDTTPINYDNHQRIERIKIEFSDIYL